jgi:hypothetical protein
MTAYEIAHDMYRAAFAKFDAVRNDYRAMKCDDATFLSARKEFDAAQKAFDAAEVEAAKVDAAF